jgi:hypothetical protein
LKHLNVNHNGQLNFKVRYELTVFKRNQREKKLEEERKL